MHGSTKGTAEYQEHDGPVDTASSGTPRVEYVYTSGVDNLDRLTQLTYPNGRVLGYTYSGDATDAALSRVSAITDGSIGGSTLVSYTYPGAGSVMRVDYEQPEVRLDLWGGTAGAYDGIDRFGRVTDHRWAAYNGSSTDRVRITHGYDRSSNRLYRRDEADYDRVNQVADISTTEGIQ